MKKLLILSLLTVLAMLNVNAQNQIGLKLGLSSYDLPMDVLDLTTQEMQLSVEKASYGVHFGVYGRIGLLGFYIQPELNFNSNSVQFKLQDINSTDSIEDLRTEKYQFIDVPVLIMFTPSIFRVYAGPVGHYFLNSTTDLNTIEGFKQEFKTLSWGYQAGVGIQILGITIDLRYEGNFNKFGDHFVIDGHSFKFASTPSRVQFSLGFKL